MKYGGYELRRHLFARYSLGRESRAANRKLLCECIRFALLVVVGYNLSSLSPAVPARAAGLNGDAELLRLAAVEQQANLEKLRIWSATVVIENEVTKTDEKLVRTTTTVDFNYERGRGTRWEWNETWKQNRLKGRDERLPPAFKASGVAAHSTNGRQDCRAEGCKRRVAS